MGKTLEELQELEQKQAEREQILAEVEKNIHRREITLKTDNYVVMANNMVLHSASKLTLYELKLLRLIIMQTQKGDKELLEYELTAKDLCKLLDIKNKDMYKRLDTMTTHIMQEVVRIGDDSKHEWKKFHWVDVCEYKKGVITIKLSEQLKPYLIGLAGCFTRYQLSEIISLKSIYAIRIYEILNGYMNENNLPYADNAVEISVSIETLRKATDTEKKFERPYDFKKKVLDIALKEICEKSKYHVSAKEYRRGHSVAGYDFLIESQAGYYHRTAAKSHPEEDLQLEGQMNLMDYKTTDNTFKIT